MRQFIQAHAFTINRILILLGVAAILTGLYFGQWDTVLGIARTLCLSCIGLLE